RSTTAAFIAALALTWAGAASAYAQTDTDTTIADFSADPSGDTYVAHNGATDGDVLLNPALGAEFGGGPGLPDDWSSNPWSLGGTANVAGEALVVDGAS